MGVEPFFRPLLPAAAAAAPDLVPDAVLICCLRCMLCW